MFKLTRKTFYIILFSILWLITAFSSFFHAVEFFELSNVTWMGIILALAFEIGQASVLMSILTSTQDRKKYTPWILMCILTLVQIIGNVYSSYKYIMLNSPENLKYFKEPIFIWTDLPDAQATVIVTYVSAAILPIVALLMTSMITNYLTDQENDKLQIEEQKEQTFLNAGEDSLLNQNSILNMEVQGLTESNQKKDEEIEQLKKQLEEAKNNENNKKQLGTGWTVVMPQNNEENDNENKEELKEEDTEQRLSESNAEFSGTTETDEEDGNGEEQPNNDNGEQPMDSNENKGSTESELPKNKMNSHFINL